MTPFILRLGGATVADAEALRVWGRGLPDLLSVLPQPTYASEVPQENPEFVEAGVEWTLLLPAAGSADEQALLLDIASVLAAVSSFSEARPHLEVGVRFGCCEMGYVEGGQSDAGVAFVLDAQNWPTLTNHDHA